MGAKSSQGWLTPQTPPPTLLSWSEGQTHHSDQKGWDMCRWNIGQVCPAERTPWAKNWSWQEVMPDSAGAEGAVWAKAGRKLGPAEVHSPWSLGKGVAKGKW